MFKSCWPTNFSLRCPNMSIGRRSGSAVSPPPSTAEPDSEDNISTGGCVVKRKIFWTVENFEEIRQSQDLVNAQKLKINVGDGADFQTEWLCYLKSDVVNERGTVTKIGLFFNMTSAPSVEVIASIHAKITGKTSMRPILRYFNTGTYGRSWGWNKFVPDESAITAIATPNGSLQIELEIKLFSTETVGNVIQMANPAAIERSFERKFSDKLHEDFGKLLESPLKSGNAETKIISKDNKEFVVNRELLSARSPVFETMFQTDMKESKTGIVQISDISSKTIRVLLQFIYTGTMHINWRSSNVIPELVYAASKYQLPDLLEFIDHICGHVCTTDNAGKLVGLARQLGLKKAERDLVQFMKKHMNNLDDIFAFAGESSASTLE